jgi:glycosyltransferase involved in cell wall biosynthesis
MKIVLGLTILNEEDNIGRILSAYADWVDNILIIDGGSTDNTLKIASKYNKVDYLVFPALAPAADGSLLNHITMQVKELISWAREVDADWIVYDDCDCVPNYLLREDGRLLIETADRRGYDALMASRMYIYGSDRHFVRMVKPFGEYVQSLWSWKTSFEMKFEDQLRHLTITNLNDANKFNILPPRCLLHYFAPNEEVIQKKMQMQRQLVGHEVQHPLQFGGELEPLPEWARIER